MKTIKDYFGIKELVDPIVYRKHGESSWKFICPMLQETLLILRKNINKPITVNNWSFGGRFTQRGLRTNVSAMVLNKNYLYLSAHMFGKAVDFDVKGMTACEVRQWIVDNADLFPYQIRLERNLKGKPISWIHLDIIQDESKPKIYLFDV
jgi:hypothetical protein